MQRPLANHYLQNKVKNAEVNTSVWSENARGLFFSSSTINLHLLSTKSKFFDCPVFKNFIFFFFTKRHKFQFEFLKHSLIYKNSSYSLNSYSFSTKSSRFKNSLTTRSMCLKMCFFLQKVAKISSIWGRIIHTYLKLVFDSSDTIVRELPALNSSLTNQ